MRSTSVLQLILLSLATSSLCAPIPPIPGSVEEECIYYSSCRPYHQRSSTQSKAAPALPEPHFPTHQLSPSEQADTVEVSLLEHHIKTPTLHKQAETPTKNSKLNAVLESAHKDKVSDKKEHDELGQMSAPAEATDVELATPQGQSPSSTGLEGKTYSFTASIIKKVQQVATTRGQKCDMMSSTIRSIDKDGDGRTIVTYTYGYSYIRTDYTSVLVVGIVVIFILAVIFVELLDKFIATTKALLGLDQGAIRLEDCGWERPVFYKYSPRAFRLMHTPAPLSPRLTSKTNLVTEETALEEKSELSV